MNRLIGQWVGRAGSDGLVTPHFEDAPGCGVDIHFDVVAARVLAFDFPDVPPALVFNLFEIDDATVEGHLPNAFDADALSESGSGGKSKDGTGPGRL